LESERRRHRSLLVQDCVEAYIAARTNDFKNHQLAKRSLRGVTMRARQLGGAFRDLHSQELVAVRLRRILEEQRLSNRSARTVEVCAESSKVRKQRFVEINKTLLRWIGPVRRGKKGNVIGKNWRRRWKAVLESAGYTDGKQLGQNILRHTAASMMIAVSDRG